MAGLHAHALQNRVPYGTDKKSHDKNYLRKALLWWKLGGRFILIISTNGHHYSQPDRDIPLLNLKLNIEIKVCCKL